MATQGKQAWKYVGTAALTGGEVLKWSAKDKVDVAGAVTDKIVGVAAEACAAGDTTPQNISILNPANCPGTVQVIAGAVIAAGALLTVTSGGKVTTAAAAGAAPAYETILGFANEAAAADLDVIEMVWLTGTFESQT